MTSSVPPPASGAWREGDPIGERRFIDVGALDTEFGGFLPEVRVAYETWGVRNAAGDNAVLIEHALTGDAHAAGGIGPGHLTPGWWDALIGPGRAVDTDRWFVVAANVLGGCQGTTGPASVATDGRRYGSRWPRITVRDQVEVERRLARVLGITRFASVVGGSMGGMRALEWLVTDPGAVGSAVLLATSAAASADQIATQTAQIEAITLDPNWACGDYHDRAAGKGPHAGLALARKFAHMTYRTSRELDLRFGRDPQADERPLRSRIAGRDADAGRFSVQSYFDHQGVKLIRRFDAGTYVSLTDTMTTYDVARGRGPLADVLGAISVPVGVAGIDSDRLYPLRWQEQLAELIPTANSVQVINSPYGHDGFLIEIEPVAQLVTDTLELVEAAC